MRTTWIPSNGFNNRLINAALAGFLVMSALVIIPGAIPAAGATTEDTTETGVEDSQEQVDALIALQCPFVASGDQILIDIVGDTGGFLLGAPDIVPNALGPIHTAVAAGTYTVQWASYDGHSIHGGLNQTQEQWYLDVGGSTSIDTNDIPEEPDYASGTLGTNLVVASDSPTVMIHHGGQPDTINSVYALCALLEPVDPPTPLLSIEKSTNGVDADSAPGPSIDVGEAVTWTYVVTNTGEVDLTGVIVTDDILGDVCTIGDLDIGDSDTCEMTGTATAGQYANVGTAVDNNGDGSTVSATDPSHYLGVATPVPGITIEKSTNGVDADSAPGPSIDVGEAVTWTYVVTNTGEVDLTGVIVTDDILGDVCTIGDLDIGDSDTCEMTGTATAGQYANVGTAVDNNGDGSTVSATDPSHYFGQDVGASATIGDTVWSDENANGKQDNGEKGIAGATVRLTLPDGSTADTTTNASGLYLFAALDAGTYKVEVIMSSLPKPSEGDLKLTTAGSFTVQLAEDQSYLDADFGVVATLPNTGIESGQIAVIALALVLAGSIALFATRKKTAFGGEDVIS